MEYNFSKTEREIENKAQEIEKVIFRFLPEMTGYQKTVIDAMHYSMRAGGKRLRPMLMQEVFRLCGGEGDIVEPFMAAMEMIHTYSLVHDDLPAMDNDEYRRGKKTTHVVYGEGMAVLAGDALLNYAFEVATGAFLLCEREKEALANYRAIAKALMVLAKKAGIYGMIGGQTADVEAEEMTDVTIDQLLFIHENKTAALIEASMMIGAILAGASKEMLAKMERCARNIGVAFQIQDDILDVIGDQALLGKPVGSDEKNHKQTYVTLKGMDKSVEEVKELSGEAIEILRSCPGDSGFLCGLVEYLIYRNK